MPMTAQEALNEMLSLQKKGENISEEDKERIRELNEYLQSRTAGKSALGSKAKDQMLELEY